MSRHCQLMPGNELTIRKPSQVAGDTSTVMWGYSPWRDYIYTQLRRKKGHNIIFFQGTEKYLIHVKPSDLLETKG